ncbi:hypothetical protein EBAPG3_011485 [Nitrosospira lacus]|uniref:Uncharacterized protein n=1 Tax=Nitrosospira lacus TaxID=1288494 RepID=A0A1W6SRD7_9PROT|nr:hypothetical protein EBAPG3_011485 [Nitrosospira lacus]
MHAFAQEYPGCSNISRRIRAEDGVVTEQIVGPFGRFFFLADKQVAPYLRSILFSVTLLLAIKQHAQVNIAPKSSELLYLDGFAMRSGITFSILMIKASNV